MDSAPLLETMTQEIERQQESLLAEARQSAEKIIADTKEEARVRRDEAIAQLRGELEALADKQRELAEAQAKKARLNIKDTITDELLQLVRAELMEITRDRSRFPKILIKLLEELLESKVGPDWRKTGRLELIVEAPGAHVNAIKDWLKNQGIKSVQVEALPGLTDGVALEDKAHTFRVSNTLHDRMDKQEKKLRGFAMQQLFNIESHPDAEQEGV